MYLDWWAFWVAQAPFKPDMFVFLDPGVEACADRIKARQRPGEDDIPVDYLRDLHATHERYRAAILAGSVVRGTKCCAHVLDTSGDYRVPGRDRDAVVQQIRELGNDVLRY
jgi:deoxyadenosine/deoxycytidine kinase